MSGHRLRALLRKEWAEALRNRAIVWTFVLVAALFVALPLGLLLVPDGALGGELARDPQLTRLLAHLTAAHPAIAALPVQTQVRVLLVRQMVPLFLILPLLGGMSVATYSIVGEKTSRSLEPLLATPVTAGELVLGKTLAAALPAVGGSWVAFLVLAAAVTGLAGRDVAGVALDGAAWATMLVIGPLVALLGIGAGVLVSARAQDARSAQQVGGVVVLPIVALAAAQGAGVFLMGGRFVAAGALVLALLDAALLAWGARSFDRDRVFTEWR
jgi:ABC-2 type transport system permease protein